MKTVLVTGATGALGHAVVARLRKYVDYRVIVTSRHCIDPDGFQLDIKNTDRLVVKINLIKPDLILHLAASFSNDFDESYSVNVDATRQMLETVQKSKYKTRVLLIGSAAEYGVVQPHECPIKEDRVLNPVSVYGLTKSWQTQLASFYSTRGVDVVLARVFNLDGLGLTEHLFVGRLQKQISEILSGKKSVIEVGALTSMRDYLTTEDAADQILAIAAHGESGKVYHVASGKPLSMRDILIKYLEDNKIDMSIVREGNELTNRSGYDVPVIYADITITMNLMKDCS